MIGLLIFLVNNMRRRVSFLCFFNPQKPWPRVSGEFRLIWFGESESGSQKEKVVAKSLLRLKWENRAWKSSHSWLWCRTMSGILLVLMKLLLSVCRMLS